MSLYETVCVIKPELAGEAIEKIVAKVQRVLTENQVKDLKQNDWGLRKLAYPIQKITTGHYLQFVYDGGGDLVSLLERQLNYEDAILRYLTIQVGKGTNPDAKPDAFHFGKVDEDQYQGRRFGGGRDREGGGRRYGRRHDEDGGGEGGYGDREPRGKQEN